MFISKDVAIFTTITFTLSCQVSCSKYILQSPGESFVRTQIKIVLKKNALFNIKSSSNVSEWLNEVSSKYTLKQYFKVKVLAIMKSSKVN